MTLFNYDIIDDGSKLCGTIHSIWFFSISRLIHSGGSSGIKTCKLEQVSVS